MERASCSAEQRSSCPLQRHFTDTHHLYFYRRNYRTGLEKAFRELPENKVELCRNEHNQIHATQEPPAMPSRDFMLNAIIKATEEVA